MAATTATTLEVNTDESTRSPTTPSSASVPEPSLASPSDLQNHDVCVCDKAIEATPSYKSILTSDSETVAASPSHLPCLPPTAQPSPASADAAMALSRLFHAPPPPFNPAHHPPPRSFSWGAPPAPPPPPPPSAPYYPPEWQRPYATATNTGCAKNGDLDSSQQYQPIYPSPAIERSSAFFPPHPPPPPPPPSFQQPANNFYYSYSPSSRNSNKRHLELQPHDQIVQGHLVTPTPKKIKMTACPAEEYSRKSKSLGLLCENFCKHDWQDGIGIDEAAKTLGVERRRIYDIVNILESLEVVQRKCKNRYHWLGFGRLPKVLSEIQEEAVLESSKLAAEALVSGVLEEAAETPPSEEASHNAKKSLGRLSRQFLQLFLVGNEVMSLMEASDRIMGKTEELPFGVASPVERKAAISKGQKTKIRRLYDIANVLASIGLVQKKEGEKRSRPSFSWMYHWTPHQIRALRNASTPSPSIKPNSAPSMVSSPLDTSKDVFANINEHGACEPHSANI